MEIVGESLVLEGVVPAVLIQRTVLHRAHGVLPLVAGGKGVALDDAAAGEAEDAGVEVIERLGEVGTQTVLSVLPGLDGEERDVVHVHRTLRQQHHAQTRVGIGEGGAEEDGLLLPAVAADFDFLGQQISRELDNIKDNKVLFPIVTIIIMETFINKMRKLKGIRKMILLEEAWKAISKEGMAEYLKYLFKTVRKFFGEAVVVTQEVEDIISSPIVKGTIINNSDCKILLDQRKYMNKFDEIQTLLGLTDKERAQILSINMANNPSRKYKEVWIGLGGSQSAVYATEVSLEEYMCYTTEETEKLELMRLTEKLGGNIELAIRQLADSKRSQVKGIGIT